ncbi:MAG: hypothetical protein ACRYF4_08485 [Janthinobacterium lividum]
MPVIAPLITQFSAKRRRLQIAWLLTTAFLFLVLSTPLNLLHGFLFAEEGTTYLRYARLARPMQALLAPHQQYFALFPNALALLVGRMLPLSWAAVCSAWLVLLVHLWLLYMVAQCERFTSGVTRILAVAAVLLAPGAAAILVGSTQTQFVFGLLCIVVLMSHNDRLPVSRTLCVLLGGLNGVISCILTPFFLFRAWRTRSLVAWLQAAILCVSCVVQALVLRHALPYASRGNISDHSPAVLLNVLSNHMLVLPFFTRFAYHAVSLTAHAPLALFALFALLSLAGFFLLAKIIWPAGPLARLLLLAGGFHACCCVIGLEGQYGDLLGAGERYFFVSNAAVALALVLRWQQLRSTANFAGRRIVTGLLGLLLLSGLVDTVRFWRLNQSGTVWAGEVRAWRADPTRVTLTANPAGWNVKRMYLTQTPKRLDIPFYTFDSNTRSDVLKALPQRLFGPDPEGNQGRP